MPAVPPDLALLAMVAADEAGLPALRAWPEWRKGGIGFGTLPPFLAWRGRDGAGWHLVLLQPREAGALVPGASPAALPSDWLPSLDLDALARPLARHPDFPGGAAVHVVQLPGGNRFRLRTFGVPATDLVIEVLRRVTFIQAWRLADGTGDGHHAHP